MAPRAARASPLHTTAPWARIGSPLRAGRSAPLLSAGVRRRRRGSLPRRAVRTPPLRIPGLCAGSGSSPPRAVLRAERRARGPLGSLRRPSRDGCLPLQGGREGDVPPLSGPHSVGPSPWRRRGDVSLPRDRPLCARGAVLPTRSYRPSWDKQESTKEASSADSLCASVACQREQRPG